MNKSMMLFLTLLTAAPAFAEPAPAPTGGAGADPSERICRTRSVIGSRLARTRQCATRAQWVEILAAERRQARDVQRQGNQPQCMTPGERAAAAGRYSALGVGCN